MMIPGVCSRTTHGSRADGMRSSISRLKVWPVVVERVSTTGPAALTVTVSSTADTSSATLISALKPVSIRTFCRTKRLKPGSSKVTEYRPIGMLGKRYAPLSSETVDWGVISAGPERVTVTPGITPPDESETLPKISPLVCAVTAPARTRQRSPLPSTREQVIACILQSAGAQHCLCRKGVVRDRCLKAIW
jgi:hypothetical protein